MKKLLPLILLACLAARLASAATNPPDIVVTGIVDLPGYKCVLLESTDADSPVRRPESFTLQEGQRDGGIEVLQIDAKAGAVKIMLEKTNSIVNLHLESEAKTSVDSRGTAPISIHLRHAALNQTLLLYGHLANRTVLRPTLAAGPVNLSSSVTNQADAALALSKALGEHGLNTIMDGEKFVMVVPADKASMAVPHSAEIKYAPAEPGSSPQPIPGGEINFPKVSAVQVVIIYGELLGGRRLKSGGNSALPGSPALQFPPSLLDKFITFCSQTPLTKEEVIYALDTLFRWQGFKVVPEGKDFIKVIELPPE